MRTHHGFVRRIAAGLLLCCTACARLDTDRARNEFLRDHPTAIVESVDVGEGDGAAAYVHIRYREGLDPSVRLEVQQYLFDAATKEWRLAPR